MFVAKKNDGSDRGELYALKAVNIPKALQNEIFFQRNFLTSEREVNKVAIVKYIIHLVINLFNQNELKFCSCIHFKRRWKPFKRCHIQLGSIMHSAKESGSFLS